MTKKSAGRPGQSPSSRGWRKRGVRPALVLDEGMAILQGIVPGMSRPLPLSVWPKRAISVLN